jgi:hypothetical protein
VRSTCVATASARTLSRTNPLPSCTRVAFQGGIRAATAARSGQSCFPTTEVRCDEEVTRIRRASSMIPQMAWVRAGSVREYAFGAVPKMRRLPATCQTAEAPGVCRLQAKNRSRVPTAQGGGRSPSCAGNLGAARVSAGSSALARLVLGACESGRDVDLMRLRNVMSPLPSSFGLARCRGLWRSGGVV